MNLADKFLLNSIKDKLFELYKKGYCDARDGKPEISKEEFDKQFEQAKNKFF